LGRSLPCLAAVLAPHEAPSLVKKDAEVRLAGLQLAAGDRATPAVGLDLVVGDHTNLGSWPGLDDPIRLRQHSILSPVFRPPQASDTWEPSFSSPMPPHCP